tara:strand:+ start:7706 stop:8101 length:396 start_codon:yes stop_codon:yes gene_type:complete
MKKLKTETSKQFIIALLIIVSPFLVYIHDSGLFDGMKGFSGFSSLRVGVWVVSLFILMLFAFIGWFYEAKHKKYRFALLAPIFMITFQLAIYLFDARANTTNDFSSKTIVYFVFVICLVLAYFLGTRKREN